MPSKAAESHGALARRDSAAWRWLKRFMTLADGASAWTWNGNLRLESFVMEHLGLEAEGGCEGFARQAGSGEGCCGACGAILAKNSCETGIRANHRRHWSVAI